jgi:uncharacterized protein
VSGAGRPDPRPRVREEGGVVTLVAATCEECGYVVAGEVPACPNCGGATAATAAGPGGRVWAATVVRIPVPGRTPPYGLAYVDLENGPRVLAHTVGEEPLAVGQEVRLAAPGAEGDLTVVAA